MTPKIKRMVNVFDVLETIKSSSTTPKKIAETSEVQIEVLGAEASKHQVETEAGPSESAKVKSLEVEEIKTSSSTPGKTAEASKTQIETTASEAEATQRQAETEAGPSEPAKEKSLETREK